MSSVTQVEVILSEERGETKSDWLYSLHTFSFGTYHNLRRLNFGTLRVFNEDLIEPGKGFAMHKHDNMEIITIMLDGTLEHRDNIGESQILQTGDVQRITAGKGIEHSEYNGSKNKKAHFLQIWVYPERRNLEPGYEKKQFSFEQFKNTFFPIVAGIPSDTALFIHQDATFYLGNFEANQTFTHIARSKQHGEYLFVIDGEVLLGNQKLQTKDSAQVTHTDQLQLQFLKPTELLLIEVTVNTL